MEKLYRPRSIVNGWTIDGYTWDAVDVCWACMDRNGVPPVPYAEAIRDYPDDDLLAEMATFERADRWPFGFDVPDRMLAFVEPLVEEMWLHRGGWPLRHQLHGGYLALEEHYIDELLTAHEVEELRAYLWGGHRIEVETEEEKLPINGSECGLGHVPLGGPVGDLTLRWQAGYPLSIPIYGYYDLRDKGTKCLDDDPPAFHLQFRDL
jgi:hypothetical protein